MNTFTTWNIDVFDEAIQTRNKIYDDEEAIAWRRFTQKDIGVLPPLKWRRKCHVNMT